MAKTGRTNEGWVTVAEAARIVGVTPAAVSYYIRVNRLDHRKHGRSTLVPIRKVEELLVQSPRRSKTWRGTNPTATNPTDELAAVRAELKAVREHLADVQKERDRLMALLESRGVEA